MLTDTQIAEVRLLAVDEMLRHHKSLTGVTGMLVRLGEGALKARREWLHEANEHHAKKEREAMFPLLRRTV